MPKVNTAFISVSIAFALLVACSTVDPNIRKPEEKIYVALDYTYYQIIGSTVVELRDQMDKYGYKDDLGYHWDAHTNWDIEWSYPYLEKDRQCKAGPIQTRVMITITFPLWEAPRGTPEYVMRKWNDYVVALQAHEDGHRQIAMEAAEEIVESLRALSTFTSCSELEQAADKYALEVLNKFRQQEASYDETTSHGLTQGARFP